MCQREDIDHNEITSTMIFEIADGDILILYLLLARIGYMIQVSGFKKPLASLVCITKLKSW